MEISGASSFQSIKLLPVPLGTYMTEYHLEAVRRLTKSRLHTTSKKRTDKNQGRSHPAAKREWKQFMYIRCCMYLRRLFI